MITDNKEKKNRPLSVFDFDGTLTYYDSFITFLHFSFGKYYFLRRLANMVLPIFYYWQRKSTQDELKSTLIKIFLSDIDEHWIHQQADIFCKRYWKKLMRPSGIQTVMTEVNAGSEVTICSAAPELILRPFANRLKIKYIGTQLETENGKLTGQITGYNCRCKQKIMRLEKVYGNLSDYYLRAWGDSRGDYELLAIAQDPHWKYFHKI